MDWRKTNTIPQARGNLAGFLEPYSNSHRIFKSLLTVTSQDVPVIKIHRFFYLEGSRHPVLALQTQHRADFRLSQFLTR